MIRKFCNEMELNSKSRPTCDPWKNDLNGFTTFQNNSMWMESFITRARGNCNMTIPIPNITQFDLNNNDVDLYPITHQNVQNVMQRKFLFEPKNQTSFKDNVMSDDHYIQIYPSGSHWPNNIIEQTEPIDLSCMKKTNSSAEKDAHLQVNNAVSHLEPDRETSSPVPSNTVESSVLILKGVYDVRHNRKPNCDRIFDEDPADPRLFVCKVCDKRVRSKWHHFQTHYSRDHRCSDCNAVYSRIDTLRSHAKKRHRTIIPRYYYGIPANVWHRVIVQCRDPPVPKPPSTPKPIDFDALRAYC